MNERKKVYKRTPLAKISCSVLTALVMLAYVHSTAYAASPVITVYTDSEDLSSSETKLSQGGKRIVF